MNYIITQESFASLASCWADPSHHLRWNSIFVLPAWLKVWWQEFGAGAELYLSAVRHGEKIIGIAPLLSGREKLLLLVVPMSVIILTLLLPPAGKGISSVSCSTI